MSFKLVYLSQQDPKWKNDILGFGDRGDTIGYLGCALTATAMLLSGHGYAETPSTLNKKLKDVGGFVSAAIVWGAVSKVHPQVTLKAFIPCSNSDAPLAQIDAAIATGQPAIVQVDSSPAAGIQTHWVVLYQRKGEDYLMLDPWPYQTDTTKEDYLMKRYAQGRSLKRAISHVILYDAIGATSGPVTTPQPQPTTDSTTSSGSYARVKDSVTWGLNIRSSIDTSSMANVVITVPAGTQLLLLESDGPTKIGAINQWVRVRESGGKEGYTAAWYLEKVAVVTPPVESTPASSPANEAPVPAPPTPAPVPSTPIPAPEPPSPSSSTSSTPAPTPSSPPSASPAPAPTPSKPAPKKRKKLILKASDTVGARGLRLRKYPSMGGSLIKVLDANTRLVVVELAEKAQAKLGKSGQWIYVREPDGKRGYVSAEYVEPA